jgi:hypothetical protein
MIEWKFFIGVVESRLDPLMLGRCRVRVLGSHTENKRFIPTDELPWAWPVSPVQSSSVNGIGQTPMGPVEGSWVVGFFRDGVDSQEPMILGTIGGIPSEYAFPRNIREGFLDPRKELSRNPRKLKKKEYREDGTGAILTEEDPSPETGELWPRQNHPFGNIIGEPDTNRLARNDEKIQDTIVQIKKGSRVFAVPTAEGDVWDEPETPYDSSYPYNHVLESESGHIFEIDDTRGVERLHQYHRSGTFSEIYPDGVKVEKIVGNSYKITLEEKYEYVQNRFNLTIDGPFNVIVNNNCNVQIKGNATISVGENCTLTAGKDVEISAKGKLKLYGEEDVEIKSGNNTTVGAAKIVALKGTSVTSNPGIDMSLRSSVAGGLGVVIPKPPQPQGVMINKPDDSTKSRQYPRPYGPYVAVKEELK